MKQCKKEESDYIGKKEYDFKLKEEVKIYKGVCGEHLHFFQRRKLKKSGKNFYTYREWKNYVSNKYEQYDIGQLEELERYLRYKSKRWNIENGYLLLLLTIMCTFVMTTLGDAFLEKIKLGQNNNIVISTAISIVIVVLYFFVCYKKFVEFQITTLCCEDYLEIIRNIIEEKKELKKELKK